MHLKKFGWRVCVLSVDPRYYEEPLDPELEQLVPGHLEIVRTRALPTRPIRVIGDLGIRSLWWHYRELGRLIKQQGVDLVYIPIPPNFSAVLGPLVRRRYGVPFAIDYIDPWVHPWPGCEIPLSRAWWAFRLGQLLEHHQRGVAGAHGGVKHSQGLTAGSDGQSGVEKKADNFLAARADGTQPFGLGMGGIVEARGVLESQHDGGKAHALQGGLIMSVSNRLRIDRIIFEEAIGTLGGGARAAGLRDGRGGLLSEGRGDHEQAFGATIIAEFSVAEFGDSPGCGLSRLRAKRGCICTKHPAIKYITC
jgi:hypothetical protein